MAKDSYWFRHDSTAGRGMRMRKISFIYGHWGKGIYWDVIEILRDQENYEYSNDEFDLKMLADLIGCKDENKFINWFNDCVKFELLISVDGKFYSQVLCDNMKRWEASKANGSKGGRPKKEKPRKNLDDNLTNNLDETKPITIREEDSIKENKIGVYKEVGHLSISFIEFQKLVDVYGSAKSNEYIDKVLNYSKNHNYKSLYLTALAWLKKDLGANGTDLEVTLEPLTFEVANIANQVPAEKQRLIKKGYTEEQILKAAKR